MAFPDSRVNSSTTPGAGDINAIAVGGGPGSDTSAASAQITQAIIDVLTMVGVITPIKPNKDRKLFYGSTPFLPPTIGVGGGSLVKIPWKNDLAPPNKVKAKNNFVITVTVLDDIDSALNAIPVTVFQSGTAYSYTKDSDFAGYANTGGEFDPLKPLKVKAGGPGTVYAIAVVNAIRVGDSSTPYVYKATIVLVKP